MARKTESTSEPSPISPKLVNDQAANAALGLDASDIAVANLRAKIVNHLRDWKEEQGHESIASAARALGESREVLSRILAGAGKDARVSLDKLARLSKRAGREVLLPDPIAEKMGDSFVEWMRRLVDRSVAHLQHRDQFEVEDQQGVMDKLVELLGEYEPKDLDIQSHKVNMICSDKRWNLEACDDYFMRCTKVAEARELKLRRVFAAQPAIKISAHAMAQCSASHHVPTSLLMIEGDTYPDKLPPAGAGFWIMGCEQIVIHESGENRHVIQVIKDGPLATFLNDAVFAPAEQEALPMRQEDSVAPLR